MFYYIPVWTFPDQQFLTNSMVPLEQNQPNQNIEENSQKLNSLMTE